LQLYQPESKLLTSMYIVAEPYLLQFPHLHMTTTLKDSQNVKTFNEANVMHVLNYGKIKLHERAP
jgi:hypothetical protein